MILPSTSNVKRSRTHRLIASRFPIVGIFDDMDLSEEDRQTAFLLESATNDRHQAAHKLALIPANSWPVGNSATIVMASFLHVTDEGGRFHDLRLGAWYACFDVKTAIAETVFHNERRLNATPGVFPATIQMRQLVTSINATLIDIRGMQDSVPELYDPDPASYPVSQAFAARHRWPNNDNQPTGGIVYDSVRHTGGTNLCLFNPALVDMPVVQGDHYEYRWNVDGNRTVVKLQNIEG